MPRLPRPLAGSLPYLLLFTAAFVVGAELARPFRSASIAFDSQASVLYFQRIVTGHPLEQALTTTPKPLLTVVYGLLYELTRDWRALAWVTLLVNGLAITVSAVLARRIAGPVAAVFTGVALVNNGDLLFDVGYALGSPYALLGWALAGLAITAPRPRYALAGVWLAFATLARVETLIVTGVAIAALGWATIARRASGGSAPSPRAWAVPLLALVALPIMMVHDLALTGDPLYWAGVSARYGAATSRELPTALQVAQMLIGRYWLMGGASVLAVVGFLQFLAQRRVALVLGLLALGPGIATFLLLLAARGIDVPVRYTAGIDAAVVFAAGAGLASLTMGTALPALVERLRERVGSGNARIAAFALVAMTALLVTGPYWRQNVGIRTAVASSLALAIDTDRALPYLSVSLARAAGGGDDMAVLLVPGPVRPRVVIGLGSSLKDVGGTASERIDVAGGYPAVGQVVFHDRAADPVRPGWADFEITDTRTVGPVTLEPLLADPVAGVWVIALR